MAHDDDLANHLAPVAADEAANDDLATQLAQVAANVAGHKGRVLGPFWSLLAHAGYEVWGAKLASPGIIEGKEGQPTGKSR